MRDTAEGLNTNEYSANNIHALVQKKNPCCCTDSAKYLETF